MNCLLWSTIEGHLLACLIFLRYFEFVGRYNKLGRDSWAKDHGGLLLLFTLLIMACVFGVVAARKSRLSRLIKRLPRGDIHVQYPTLFHLLLHLRWWGIHHQDPIRLVIYKSICIILINLYPQLFDVFYYWRSLVAKLPLQQAEWWIFLRIIRVE
jgi:hypothetical protein